MLGELPRDWPTMTPRQLASRASRPGPGAVEAGAPTPQANDGLAAKLRGKVPGDTMLAIAGLGSLAAGLLMVVWPQTTALVFVVLL